MQEYYIEFIQVGTNLKVVAIDPATGIEAVVFGPSTLKHELQKLAVRKLEYLLAKNNNDSAANGH